MPTTSPAQHRLMAMVAHDPVAAKRLGIPQSVGAEFVHADKAKAAEDERHRHMIAQALRRGGK